MIEFAGSVKQEWLETNGLGGFASSTVTGLNTRRYHGLLIAATKPPVGRLLLLSKLEETVVVNGERFELSANQYPGVIHPQGFQYLADFRHDPCPIFLYKLPNGVEIEKRVFMIQGENSTVIEYQANAPCTLELRPLIAFRDYHATTHENSALNPAVEMHPGRATMQPYPDLPALHLNHNAHTVETNGAWYRNFVFTEEQARGLDDHEDLFNPCTLHFDTTARVIASTEIRSTCEPPTPHTAADQFIVNRGARKTIIAGYHWFSDWGRDTMIALPGLTLTTGRFDVAKQILLAFADLIDQGMLPNRFPDAGETPEYNTVDATLWFFEAVRAYLEATGDHGLKQTFFPKLADIIDWHIRGTRYNIKVDPEDGLLACGQPGVQLTWMDAKVGDWVVTPRIGKPVEIQALWYNALCIMGCQTMADKARVSFNRKFWNDQAQCLYDVVDGDTRDASIRPNQIFAVSLPHAILDDETRARAVVDTVQRELLTPMGLRTLARSDPDYHGVYQGGPRERDGAYHRGTVWPWLMGPFLGAYLKLYPGSKAQAKAWLMPLETLQKTRGQLPEIADGDFPHAPKGCIAQAWSVAEVLRMSGIMS